MEYEMIERTVFYNHFCYDCYKEDRNPYYYGVEKNVVRKCPRCGSLNVNAEFGEKDDPIQR